MKASWEGGMDRNRELTSQGETKGERRPRWQMRQRSDRNSKQSCDRSREVRHQVSGDWDIYIDVY